MHATTPTILEELPDRLRLSLAHRPLDRDPDRWAPRLAYGRHFAAAPTTARPAAVLVALVRDGDDWLTPLTLRPSNMAHHAGQVCLPGGKCEPGESPESAARREFEEELGAPATAVKLIGRLPPVYVYKSGFRVTPLVGWIDGRWTIRENPGEVERVFLPTLTELMSQAPDRELTIRRGPVQFKAPYFEVEGARVWGATAIILGELLGRVREALSL